MAVIRNPPPSPQQGGCGPNLAIKVAAGYSGILVGASPPRQPPVPAEPGPATALDGPGRHGAFQQAPCRAVPAARGFPLPAAELRPAGGPLHFAGDVEHHGPSLRLPATGGSELQLARSTLPDRHGRRLAPCVPQSPTPQKRVPRSARPRSFAAQAKPRAGRAQQHRTRGPPRGVQQNTTAASAAGTCRLGRSRGQRGQASLNPFAACSAEHHVPRSTTPQTRTPRARWRRAASGCNGP